MLLALFLALFLQADRAALVCTVTAAGVPVDDAEIVVAGRSYRTDGQGRARIDVVPGRVELTVVKTGFAPVASTVTVSAGEPQPVTIELEPLPSVQESVTVSATRTERGIEDQPMRVEVLDREEVDEKLLMTPGDVVMMLNEMGGMRAQATSPSLGAASVRIQGMRGRYTRFLSDGLPLFGEQISLSLMQIPPLDLDHVEVIKGIASSLYGSGALAGVVNLTSRRPGKAAERQLLLNRSSRGSTDAVGWYSTPLTDRGGLTLIVSANGQSRTDIDGDTWSDTPRYERAVVRPRIYWDNQAGTTFFATAGGTWEDRIGGSMPGASLPLVGGVYREGLNTRRADIGTTFQTVSPGGVVWTVRGSWTNQRQEHRFGEVVERDTRGTGFGELTGRRRLGHHTLVGGAAIERDRFEPLDVPSLAYTFMVPGIFVQDDVDVGRWLALSGSARYDHHSRDGSFLSPRASALLRRGQWSSRLSFGTGFFAPTPVTEETDTAGLSRLAIRTPLEAERGRSISADLTRTHGPLSATLTLFHSRVNHPVEVERTDQFLLSNLAAPTTNEGLELLGIWKEDDFSLVGNYAYIRSRETSTQGRVEVPLTPRHTLGLDAAWEWSAYRLGLEWFYTGRQRLEANPYRDLSRPYSVFGVLFTRRIGRTLLFVNGENLTDVRQTRWDPLLRPTRGLDGRWTVDGWAPLDGRTINGGIRLTF